MYARGATAVPPANTPTHLSAALPLPAAASGTAATVLSVAASASATRSSAAPVPQTTYPCSAVSNTAMSQSPSSPSSAAAADAAPRSTVRLPATSSSIHSSSVTAVDTFANSSCTRRPPPRVTRVRHLLLNRSAAAFDSRTPDADPPSSSVSCNTLPSPSGPPDHADGPASSCSPVASRVPSLTVAAASSSVAHATASFHSDSSALLTPDTAVSPSPQAAASTLSATAIVASRPSYTGAAPFVAGAARQYRTASVLYTAPGSASISHSSVPRICRGVPLVPFIRSRRSSTLPHMHLFGHKEKNESSFSRVGIRKAAKHLFTVEPTPTCRDPLVREQAVEVFEGENSSRETAHVQLTAAQQQSAKAGFPATAAVLFSQRQGTKNEERLSPQQKAHRHVQGVLPRHGCGQQLQQRPPPEQVKQCIPSFGVQSQLKTEKCWTKVVETPQEQQWAPKFASASYPHHTLHQETTYKPGKSCAQPDRSQSPAQAKQQQMRSQPQKQQEAAAAKQVQKQLTRLQQQQQQRSPRGRLESLDQQQERLHSLERQKLSQQQQQHGMTRRQQTNPAGQPHKKEMSGSCVAVAGAYTPLCTSNNNTWKQLICYVCLSAATAEAENGEIPVTFSNRDGLLSSPTSGSPVADVSTGKVVPRRDLMATDCLQQAAAVFECQGHSSEGFTSLAVSTKGHKSGPCNRTNTKDNVSSGSRCELQMSRSSSSGSTGVGDPSRVGRYVRKNSAVISGGERSGGRTSTPTSCRFYEVGGLVLCQKCALLPGVHTAQQVNALLEEALCFLAEEAGVNFNHPALLELHRIALGSSTGHLGSTFSSPTDTTDIHRSDTECGRMHSNACNRKSTCITSEARSSSSSSSKQTTCTASCSISPSSSSRSAQTSSTASCSISPSSSSRSEQTSSTASCSVSPSSSRSEQTSSTASCSVSPSSCSSDDDGCIGELSSPTWEFSAINCDMNSTRHRRRCDRIMAASQGDLARGGDTADNRRNSAGEGRSKTEDGRKADASHLSSRNTAWEFPFYVEATSLSALLPPSDMVEAPPPAAVLPSAAGSLESTSRCHVSTGRQPLSAAVATHPATTANNGEAAAAAPISETVVVPASHSAACLPAEAGRAAAPPPSGARFSPPSACICPGNKKNRCLPPPSVSELGDPSVECSCHVASRSLYPSEKSAGILQQRVPERIVFGLCETLKVYLPQAAGEAVQRAAGGATSAPAFKQMGRSSGAAATRTAAAGELTGTGSSAEVAANAADQDASRKGGAGPSALSVRREAQSPRRAPTEVMTSRSQTALVTLNRRTEPCGCVGEKVSGLAAVERAELPKKTAEEVPAGQFSQQQASGEMEVKPTAAVSVDPSEEGEVSSARAHAATQAVNGLSAAEGERTTSSSQTTYNKSVLDAVCQQPSPEARGGAVQSETTGGVQWKEAHPTRLEGYIGEKAADAAEGRRDRVKGSTETSPAIKEHPEGLRHAEEELFARGAGLQSAVIENVPSQSEAAGARETVGGNQVWRQPRAASVDRGAGQRELVGNDSPKEDTTSVEGLPHRAAAHMPADSACPSAAGVTLHTNDGLSGSEACTIILFPHGKEDYVRPCGGKQAAAAAGTEASLIRARVEDTAPLIDASFQPAVHRVAVARGLPEAVFLAHLGHELLHAYIWCTTDVATACATVPTEPKREEANYVSAGNTKGLTPRVSKESSGFPTARSPASARAALHNVGRPADDAGLKPACSIGLEKHQHANGYGNRRASAPADTWVGEYMWGAPDTHSSESASQFHVRTGKERTGAFTGAESNSVSKRRGVAVAETMLASCPSLTNDGAEKGRKGKKRNLPGVKTHPQQRSSSAVPSPLALSTSAKLADTQNKKPPHAQRQPGEKKDAAAGAAPLHLFPPLELALEEGLCNCVAAALLERRASASYGRLQKLIAAADASKRKRQAITVKAENSCARQSVPGIEPFVTRFPVDLGSEGSQAVQQNKIEQTLVATSMQRHDLSPHSSVQGRKAHQLVARGNDRGSTKKCTNTCSRDDMGQLLLTQCHRRPPQQHLLPVAQQQQQLHSKHPVEAIHKEQQQRPHRKCELDLKQQQQQHPRLRQQHIIGELQDSAQQHRQRNSLHAQPRMSRHEQERHLEGDRLSERQQRTQDKCYEQPLRRQAEPQDAHVGRLIFHEQLQRNDLPAEILRHLISVCLHELHVIQMRLRLTETDSHAVYGKSYKMLRILVKRFGLRTVLETARKRRLQQLVDHCATIPAA